MKKINNYRRSNKKGSIYREFNLSSIVKQPMTTKSELEYVAEKLNIEPLRIVWSKDIDPSYKGPQIINLGNMNLGGTHWTASYKDMYFDSFGLIPPQILEDYDYEYVPLQLQRTTEGFCGNWCILWLYYAMQNEIDKFYNLFNTVA